MKRQILFGFHIFNSKILFKIVLASLSMILRMVKAEPSLDSLVIYMDYYLQMVQSKVMMNIL